MQAKREYSIDEKLAVPNQPQEMSVVRVCQDIMKDAWYVDFSQHCTLIHNIIHSHVHLSLGADVACNAIVHLSPSYATGLE